MTPFDQAGGLRPGGLRLSQDELLADLSRNSPLLMVLRTLYSLMLDYGLYLMDDGNFLIFSKEQIVVLVERKRAEALVKDLPALAAEGLIQPIEVEELESPEDTQVLILERLGARLAPIAGVLSPSEPEYPQWWEAPIPFALCARGGMKLNPTAAVMFGRDLERLTVAELPEKDEFIVELEGRGRPCFLSFRRLEPNIFTLDDCTAELVEAQDISWWAAVGRAWIQELEGGGRTWRRLGAVPEGFQGRAWSCEWQGRFQGYLCVEEPSSEILTPEPQALGASAPETIVPSEPAEEEPRPDASEGGQGMEETEGTEPIELPEKPKKRARRASAKSSKPDKPKKEDEVLKAIGPQTMGLLAAGLARDGELAPEPEELPAKKPRNKRK